MMNGAFAGITFPSGAPLFLFPEKAVVIFCIQRHKVVRSSANRSWMFEGIGGNHQQVEQSELSGHRHCLRICEKTD